MNIYFYHNYFLNKKEIFTARYIFIISLLFIFVSIILFIPYIDYCKIRGQVIVKDNEYLILSNVTYFQLTNIKEECIIDNNKKDCEIKKIDNNKGGYLILLKVSLEDKYKIKYYPIEIIFEKETTTFYKKIKQQMKGWFL